MDTAFVTHLRLFRNSANLRSARRQQLTALASRACGADCVQSSSRYAELFTSSEEKSIPIEAIAEKDYKEWLERQDARVRAWMKATQFNPKKAGSTTIVPSTTDDEDILSQVILSTGDGNADPWSYAALAQKLPHDRCYHLVGNFELDKACLGWALAGYKFNKYKSKKGAKVDSKPPVLKASPSDHTSAAIAATYLVRDLINHPAEDLTPSELENAIRALGEKFGAATESIVGSDLLTENFPMVHAVGRAAKSPGCEPRVVDLKWNENDTSLPLVVLVGKGVCYDTGGLDIKPAAGMRNMKKDMGGAATALGLAAMIMQCKLPVRLRLLVSAVENSLGGDAYRPGDVLQSRKGLTTEIDNTDAEGRLVLGDALHYACESKPSLLVDFATLTGAQRIALGTEIPSSFCNQKDTGAQLQKVSAMENDLIWELPLHQPYRRMLDSSVADMKNASSGGFAGAITAALFLNEFVAKDVNWIHIDHMGFNVSSSPGRPEGGEANGMRGVFRFICDTFAA